MWRVASLSWIGGEAESLEVPFDEGKIHRELININGNKAPGPDGFTSKFAQTFWPEFNGEMILMF